MLKEKSLLIADDHPLIRKGIRLVFAGKPTFTHIYEAKDGMEALSIIENKRPEFAILDIDMPRLSGLEVARTVTKNFPQTALILLTIHKEYGLFREAQAIGIKAYLLKDFAVEELENCINQLRRGEPFISDKLETLFKPDSHLDKKVRTLTNREKEILRMIAEKKTSELIGRQLHISVKTVENHRYNIMKKLNLPPKSNALNYWVLENEHLLRF